MSIQITNDSEKAITVSKKDDQTYFVRQYNLTEPYECTFEQNVSGRYIKLKTVEQNSDGNQYAIGYNDDGRWYIRTFGRTQISEFDQKINEIDLNNLLELNNFTMTSELNHEPFINVCFVDDNRLYVALFHNYT